MKVTKAFKILGKLRVINEAKLDVNVNDYRHKWRYDDDSVVLGCCADCRMKYSEFPDFILPDKLWEEINPTETKEAGLLCPTCATNRLNFLGMWYDFNDDIIKHTKAFKDGS